MTTLQPLPPWHPVGRGGAANDAGDLLLTQAELRQLTGYKRPAQQLAELHRLGYWRARRAPITGRIVLERAHYEAVARGDDTQPAHPAERPLSKPTRLDALRFRTLIDTAPGCLCFMGKDYRTADEFRAAIDAYRLQEGA